MHRVSCNVRHGDDDAEDADDDNDEDHAGCDKVEDGHGSHGNNDCSPSCDVREDDRHGDVDGECGRDGEDSGGEDGLDVGADAAEFAFRYKRIEISDPVQMSRNASTNHLEPTYISGQSHFYR